MIKTNAMRILDKAGIAYGTAEFIPDKNDVTEGVISKQIGFADKSIFKTLVTKGDKTGVAIFCLSLEQELCLKKAALVSGNKKIEMVPPGDLLKLTGYIKGGCSPIGMKKDYNTFIEMSSLKEQEIAISAGSRGVQIIINPNTLVEFIGATLSDIKKDK